jgi:CYTH domain-containing protein
MAKEIERKFLVNSDQYRTLARGVHYHQGYIPTVSGVTVRVRIAGDHAFVTLKSKAKGFSRDEYEYEIPKTDAEEMLSRLCAHPTIEKYRYVIPAQEPGLKWEIDEFLGDNAGLVVAEIEVPDENTTFTRPSWVGEEVTGDHRYYNSALCVKPFKDW